MVQIEKIYNGRFNVNISDMFQSSILSIVVTGARCSDSVAIPLALRMN